MIRPQDEPYRALLRTFRFQMDRFEFSFSVYASAGSCGPVHHTRHRSARQSRCALHLIVCQIPAQCIGKQNTPLVRVGPPDRLSAPYPRAPLVYTPAPFPDSGTGIPALRDLSKPSYTALCLRDRNRQITGSHFLFFVFPRSIPDHRPPPDSRSSAALQHSLLLSESPTKKDLNRNVWQRLLLKNS